MIGFRRVRLLVATGSRGRERTRSSSRQAFVLTLSPPPPHPHTDIQVTHLALPLLMPSAYELRSSLQPPSSSRRRGGAPASNAHGPPSSDNDHSLTPTRTSRRRQAAAAAAELQEQAVTVEALQQEKAAKAAAARQTREAKAAVKKATELAARQAKAAQKAAAAVAARGAAMLESSAVEEDPGLLPRPLSLRAEIHVVAMCERALPLLAFKDPYLPEVERAVHLSTLHRSLAFLADSNSHEAEEVQRLIDDGVITAPEYAGVRAVMVLLHQALPHPFLGPALGDLVDMARLRKALDALDFPLSTRRVEQELARAPDLEQLDGQARWFGVLDQWVKALAAALEITPIFKAEDVNLLDDSVAEVEQPLLTAPPPDATRGVVNRLFRASGQQEAQQTVEDRPPRSPRPAPPAREEDRKSSPVPQTRAPLPRVTVPSPRNEPERQGEAAGHRQVSFGEDAFYFNRAQVLNLLGFNPPKVAPKSAPSQLPYVCLQRASANDEGLAAALADPHSGCADPAGLQPLLENMFNLIVRMGFSMQNGSKSPTFIRPRDGSAAQVVPELENLTAFLQWAWDTNVGLRDRLQDDALIKSQSALIHFVERVREWATVHEWVVTLHVAVAVMEHAFRRNALEELEFDFDVTTWNKVMHRASLAQPMWSPAAPSQQHPPRVLPAPQPPLPGPPAFLSTTPAALPLYLPPPVVFTPPVPPPAAHAGLLPAGAGRAPGQREQVGTLQKPDHSKYCWWHLMSGHDQHSCVVQSGQTVHARELNVFPNEHEWLKAQWRMPQGKEREAVFAKIVGKQRQRLAPVMAALRRAEGSN